MKGIEKIFTNINERLSNGIIRIPFAEKWSVPQWLVSLCIYGWFALVVVWFVADCFFGQVINTDECYMALCCRDYAQQPIAMLTFYLGWLAIQVFGDQGITLRLLMCLCVFVGVGVPCWYCHRRTGSIRWPLFIFTCILIAVRSQYYKFYGWDLGPIIFAGPLITFIISLYDGLTVKRVVYVGIFAALMILSRVPSGIIVVPVCFVSLWVATKGQKDRNKAYWNNLGIGLVSFTLTAMAVIYLMKGSVSSYIMSWRPENIITGHGVREAMDFYLKFLKEDFNLIYSEGWIAKYALFSIFLLLLFSRNSRLLPGAVLLVLLSYQQLVHHGLINVPHVIFDLAIILLPILYNLKSLLIGSRERLEIDSRKYWTMILFVFVMVIGSDRLLRRVDLFYMLPIFLVSAYPVRRGIIFWILLFLTFPGWVFSTGYRIQRTAICSPLENVLPRHKYVYDEVAATMYVSPLEPVTDLFKREGKRVCTFSQGRYAPSYLYYDGLPYRLNVFHFYYNKDFIDALDDFAENNDAMILYSKELPLYSQDELPGMMRERGFYLTGRPGEFLVYERIRPRDFITIRDTY